MVASQQYANRQESDSLHTPHKLNHVAVHSTDPIVVNAILDRSITSAEFIERLYLAVGGHTALYILCRGDSGIISSQLSFVR
jgi:hypothetical protein